MVKKNSEKITIFGSQGDLGSFLVKNLCSKYQVIAVSKKSKKNSEVHNITFSKFVKSKSSIYPKNISDKKKLFNSKAIIITIGKFKKTRNDLNMKLHESNFEINYKFLNYLVINKKKFKNGCRIIVITSMNADISNSNSLQYCMSKAKLSTAIDNFKTQLKDTKISIENLMPGPINTKMKKREITNSLSKNDILQVCNFLINLRNEITLDKIKIFNKKNFFNLY